MNAFFPLWRRELATYFRTSIGYVAGTCFLAIAGFGLWRQAAHLARSAAEGDLVQNLFGTPVYWLALLVATPLLTMRLFAEEQRAGTLETLLAAPVTETQVVLAKFAAAYAAFLLLWLPTLAYAAILRQCGANLPPLDWGPVAAAYLGTALIGAFFVALGLLGSLLTRHQAVAAMAGFATAGLALAGGRLPFYAHTAPFREFAAAVSATRHMADFAAGIVDTRAVVWYVGGTALVLFTAVRILEARRLR